MHDAGDGLHTHPLFRGPTDHLATTIISPANSCENPPLCTSLTTLGDYNTTIMFIRIFSRKTNEQTILVTDPKKRSAKSGIVTLVAPSQFLIVRSISLYIRPSRYFEFFFGSNLCARIHPSTPVNVQYQIIYLIVTNSHIRPFLRDDLCSNTTSTTSTDTIQQRGRLEDFPVLTRGIAHSNKIETETKSNTDARTRLALREQEYIPLANSYNTCRCRGRSPPSFMYNIFPTFRVPRIHH